MLVLRLARVGGWMGLLQATRSVRRAQPHSKPHGSSRTASRSGPLRERLRRPWYFLVERFPLEATDEYEIGTRRLLRRASSVGMRARRISDSDTRASRALIRDRIGAVQIVHGS